jgi:hypothetical protein
MIDSKNDQAWLNLFDKYNILQSIRERGYFIITSQQINVFREARLMTKFDYKSHLPELFLNNQLSILPISRGSYIISSMTTFHDFDFNHVKIHKIDFPEYIESIDYKNITGESTALHCAYVTGILQDFCGDSWLKLTVSGRMGSSSFTFQITSQRSNLDVKVNNAQIEIDAGYEGLEALYLIEAKNSISNDFIIRQLYYPFRLWNKLIRKSVKLIFMTYTNGIFHLREYTFDDPSHYNSIRLVRQKKYAIRESRITFNSIQQLLNVSIIIPEPKIPFPQADSFERIINLCEILNLKTKISKNEITENYDFDGRQTNYYTDAGRYLGLVQKSRDVGTVEYSLTEKGKRMLKLRLVDRQLEYANLILKHQAFKNTLKKWIELNYEPSKPMVIEIMKNSNLYNVQSESTYTRRASTVISWVRWILDLIDG